MKLRIPTMLLTALLAVQATYTAKADYINGGVFYDVGKETYSDKQNPIQDDGVCWAATGANMVQYWQDMYRDSADQGKTHPDGVSGTTTYTPTGTAYLDVYKHFLNVLPNDGSGNIGWYTSSFCDWFFMGKDIQANDVKIASGADGGFYQTAFHGMTESTFTYDTRQFDGDIPYGLQDAGGSIGLWILQSPVSDSSTHTFSHEITCWGYESKGGEITSLILCDSDDKYFGAFRVDVKRENGQIYLVTDHKTNALWGADYATDRNRVAATTFIYTPIGIYKSPEKNPASTSVGDAGKVVENTRLSESQTCSTGVTVGNNETVVVLTSETGKGLTISADPAKDETGLHITPGAMASLSSLEVSGFNKSGIVTDGHLYVGDVNDSHATLNVHGNSTDTNGGGVQNNTFLNISQCERVTFSGNHANTGKGGAIYNRGNTNPDRPTDNTTVSIRGNSSVVFSDNTAAAGQGNDIYNGVGSSLNISNNESVLFSAAEGCKGEASIVNKGTTYLGVAWGKTLAFENAALDSRGGTTYFGRDINNTGNDRYEGFVDFKDDNGNQLSIGHYEDPAEMQNVWIDATGITGEGVANSLISHMNTVATDADGHVSTGYTLQKLTLDTTSQLGASGAITLNNVNITLGENIFDKKDTFDISSLFLTTTNFVGAITFDASALGLKPEELPEAMMVQLAANVIGALEDQGKLIKFITGGYEYEFLKVQEGNMMVFGNAHPVVPEPTTGTLSLLALAGLCARRRRK